jgi:hypothetical protein
VTFKLTGLGVPVKRSRRPEVKIQVPLCQVGAQWWYGVTAKLTSQVTVDRSPGEFQVQSHLANLNSLPPPAGAGLLTAGTDRDNRTTVPVTRRPGRTTGIRVRGHQLYKLT